MRSLRALSAMALLMAVLVVGGRAARGQQTIAEFAEVDHAIFTSQDLETLDKVAKLSPAQREAIETLMRDALSRARQEYGGMLHESEIRREAIYQVAAEAGGTPEAYGQARKKYMSMYVVLEDATNKKIAAIEREALGDIRGVLKSEQVETGWPAFERFRRRLVLEHYSWGTDMGKNPRVLVKGAKLSTADIEAVEPVLARYDLQIDPLLVQRMEGLAHMHKENLEKAASDDFDNKSWRTMWNRPDLMTAEIKRINVRAAGAVEAALSEDGKKLFRRQRVGVELTNEVERPAVEDRVRRIVKLKSLSQEQKDSIEALIEKADEAVFQIALAELRSRDDAALRDPAPTEEEVQKRSAEMGKSMNAQMTSLIKSLRAALTPEQREEVDLYFLNKDGGDPFKAARVLEEQSQWNLTPEKAEEQLKKQRGW
jgi:hypothetical protein